MNAYEKITLVLRAPRGAVDTTALHIAVQRYLTERVGLPEIEGAVTGLTIEPDFSHSAGESIADRKAN